VPRRAAAVLSSSPARLSPWRSSAMSAVHPSRYAVSPRSPSRIMPAWLARRRGRATLDPHRSNREVTSTSWVKCASVPPRVRRLEEPLAPAPEVAVHRHPEPAGSLVRHAAGEHKVERVGKHASGPRPPALVVHAPDAEHLRPPHGIPLDVGEGGVDAIRCGRDRPLVGEAEAGHGPLRTPSQPSVAWARRSLPQRFSRCPGRRHWG